LAEASAGNSEWDIGWGLDSEEKDNQIGWGQNLMGHVLEEIRQEFVEHEINPNLMDTVPA
jgi:predicted NAD-dependent protein-ADP-ribosyltransferase YbiA (DUF1768 family)